MSVRIKLKGYDIVVLPFEGKVLGRTHKGTRPRKEIFTSKDRSGYHVNSNRGTAPEARRARLIWYAVNGPIPEGMQINHINRKRDDDRITNLELVTNQENSIARGKYKNNTTGYRGVTVKKDRNNQYDVTITYNYKTIYLGRYKCILQAARAYDEAARKYHGKFAILNFPDTDKDSP